jgi:hypothetical protein
MSIPALSTSIPANCKMNATNPSPPPQVGLAELSRVPLNEANQHLLEAALRNCGGSREARCRKQAEARDLLALAQISGRLQVGWLDLSADLRALVELRVPVPLLPNPTGPLRVAPAARLGLCYPQQAAVLPQPGIAFVRILAPHPVWLPNVSPDRTQVLCLGTTLPAGILLKEIILMAYRALALLAVQMDALNAAGVLNPIAGDWWQHNTKMIPLCREPFIFNQSNHA